MNSERQVGCPHCGKPIHIEELLAHDVEERIRSEVIAAQKAERDAAVASAISERDAAVLAAKTNLESAVAAAKTDLESAVASAKAERDAAIAAAKSDRDAAIAAAKSDRDAAIAAAKMEERETLHSKLIALEEQSASAKLELQSLRAIELEHLRLKAEQQKQVEKFAIDLERKVIEASQAAAAEAKRIEHERNEMHQRELQKKLDDQVKLIEELQKKSQQGSQQLQGEVQELALEEFLANTFPTDVVEPVEKGMTGADCMHLVMQNGKPLGKILYESKRTKAFQAAWIEKLKDDMRLAGADLGVIVTETMPKDMGRFGNKDGVWVCTYSEFKGLAFVLRELVLQVNLALLSQENKGDKMVMLYNYLMSPEFKNQIESVMDAFQTMQSDLLTERRSMEKHWKQREKQIDKVVLSMSGVIGSLSGIAGTDLAQFTSMQLPGNIVED